MKIDASHRNWFVVTIGIIMLSVMVYVPYALWTPGGPRGGTWIGLIFGSTAALALLYAWLLSARKKILLLRLGSVTWWMRGHLWLGALSLPLALFHGAFQFGGALTTMMMVLLIVVVVSGLVGTALQHTLPAVMTTQVPSERTYEQIDRFCGNLRKEAYELVAAVCGSIDEAAAERTDIEKIIGETIKDPKKTSSADSDVKIKEFYLTVVCPFLKSPRSDASPLSNATSSELLYDDLRPRIANSLHATIDELARICQEVRELRRQVRMHRWLHGWLILHIPLSMALVILLVVHMFTALYY